MIITITSVAILVVHYFLYLWNNEHARAWQKIPEVQEMIKEYKAENGQDQTLYPKGFIWRHNALLIIARVALAGAIIGGILWAVHK